MISKNIKIFATDIDDTILPSGYKDIPSEIIDMFSQLQQNNIKTVLVTGRDLVTIGRHINTPNIDYFIGANGAFIYDFARKKIIWEKEISFSDFKLIEEFAYQQNVEFVIMDHKHIYYSDGHSDLDSPFLSKHQHKMKSINDYTGDTPLHIITIKEKYPNPEIMKNFASFLKEKNIQAEISSRWTYGFFISPVNINKSITLIFLATLLGFTKDQIIAFGDSSNDVEMIRDVGYGVAMANALDEVKNVAKDIAEDTRDLGVYKKAKELKLIN